MPCPDCSYIVLDRWSYNALQDTFNLGSPKIFSHIADLFKAQGAISTRNYYFLNMQNELLSIKDYLLLNYNVIEMAVRYTRYCTLLTKLCQTVVQSGYVVPIISKDFNYSSDNANLQQESTYFSFENVLSCKYLVPKPQMNSCASFLNI